MFILVAVCAFVTADARRLKPNHKLELRDALASLQEKSRLESSAETAPAAKKAVRDKLVDVAKRGRTSPAAPASEASHLAEDIGVVASAVAAAATSSVHMVAPVVQVVAASATEAKAVAEGTKATISSNLGEVVAEVSDAASAVAESVTAVAAEPAALVQADAPEATDAQTPLEAVAAMDVQVQRNLAENMHSIVKSQVFPYAMAATGLVLGILMLVYLWPQQAPKGTHRTWTNNMLSSRKLDFGTQAHLSASTENERNAERHCKIGQESHRFHELPSGGHRM